MLKTLTMVTKSLTFLPMLQKSQPIHKTAYARNITVLSMENPRLCSLTHIANVFFFEKPTVCQKQPCAG